MIGLDSFIPQGLQAMTSFLFWNVGQCDLRPLLGRAVHRLGIDVLLLAEAAPDDAAIVAALRAATGREFMAHSQGQNKVRVFSNLAAWRWKQYVPATERLVAWHVKVGSPKGFILLGAHLVSKNNMNADEQALLAVEVAKEIRLVEEKVGHQRTLLVGDLNMNPFDTGMLGANALHAVMARTVARREERIVQGMPYPYFYNPMWGLFGDRTPGPEGTYYYSGGVAEAYWHMLDQVLLRPPLMDQLQNVQILASIDGESLLTKNGLPDAANYSDHLPLLFRLKLD